MNNFTAARQIDQVIYRWTLPVQHASYSALGLGFALSPSLPPQDSQPPEVRRTPAPGAAGTAPGAPSASSCLISANPLRAAVLIPLPLSCSSELEREPSLGSVVLSRVYGYPRDVELRLDGTSKPRADELAAGFWPTAACAWDVAAETVARAAGMYLSVSSGITSG